MKIDHERLAELRRRPAFIKGRFRNPERTPAHGFREFLQWRRDPNRRRPQPKRFPVHRPGPEALEGSPARPVLTWIGHASFLLRCNGWNLLTDPVLSDRASPLSFAGPRRCTPPALSVEDLPEIHAVVISHNHYDHLDAPTVRALHRRFGDRLRWRVPLGLAQWFRRRGIRNVRELAWWEHDPEDGLDFHFVPTQHFSGRGLRDHNLTLWGGWMLDFGDFSAFFAGDTGYGSVFREIGQVFRGIDLALLPIGAYEPRWFMKPVHVSPEEAVDVHLDLGARQSVAMHWGTFVLTDEPVDEPPRRLAEALQRRNLNPDEFRVLAHGQTIEL